MRSRWTPSLLLLLACSAVADVIEPLRPAPGQPALPAADPIVALELTPGSMVIEPFYVPQASFRLSAIGRSGERYTATGVRWSTSAPTIAPIDSVTGAFRPGLPGVSTITARSGALTATASVTVLPLCRPLIFASGPGSMRVGETAHWKAVVCTARANGDTTITWSSSDSTIVKIDSIGVGVARRPGVVAITAANATLGAVSVVTTVVPDSTR